MGMYSVQSDLLAFSYIGLLCCWNMLNEPQKKWILNYFKLVSITLKLCIIIGKDKQISEVQINALASRAKMKGELISQLQS